MSEQFLNHEAHDLELRAVTFLETHIEVLPADQASYHKVQVEQWSNRLENEEKAPLWLRRTFDMGSEFGAVIDYCALTPNEQRIYGSIEIDGDEISVIIPDGSGSGEPKEVSREQFDLEALGRAIEMIETLR